MDQSFDFERTNRLEKKQSKLKTMKSNDIKDLGFYNNDNEMACKDDNDALINELEGD
jgi:hypothetical protein